MDADHYFYGLPRLSIVIVKVSSRQGGILSYSMDPSQLQFIDAYVRLVNLRKMAVEYYGFICTQNADQFRDLVISHESMNEIVAASQMMTIMDAKKVSIATFIGDRWRTALKHEIWTYSTDFVNFIVQQMNVQHSVIIAASNFIGVPPEITIWPQQKYVRMVRNNHNNIMYLEGGECVTAMGEPAEEDDSWRRVKIRPMSPRKAAGGYLTIGFTTRDGNHDSGRIRSLEFAGEYARPARADIIDEFAVSITRRQEVMSFLSDYSIMPADS